jgi:hypothetical protein
LAVGALVKLRPIWQKACLAAHQIEYLGSFFDFSRDSALITCKWIVIFSPLFDRIEEK